MSQQQFEPSTGARFDLFDGLIFLAKNKYRLVGSLVLGAVLGAGISYLVPNTYKASARVLPPRQGQSGTAAVLSQLGGVSGLAAGAAGLKSPNELYVGMLESRTLADKLITRFDLKKVFGTPSQEKTRKFLADATSISTGRDGMIDISVLMDDKKLVAPLTNAYVEELIQLNKTLAITEAAQRRKFFEQQLVMAKDNLAAAEVKLKQTLDTHGVISVDSDSRSVLETVGQLRAQISAKEIQKSSMGKFVTAQNPDYRRVEEELRSLRSELSKLENGRSANRSTASGGQDEHGEPAGLANIKTLRDVKYYQMLYEVLAKQYEAARLDEAKDPAIIQFLDVAMEPEKQARPKRMMYLLLGALISLMLVLLKAVADDFRARIVPGSRTEQRWTTLKQHLSIFGRGTRKGN